MPLARRVIGLVFGLGLVLGAVAFAATPVQDVLAEHDQVAAAEPVEATVTAAEFGRDVDSHDRIVRSAGGGFRVNNPEREVTWSVRLTSRYDVGGETCTGSAVTRPGAAGGTSAIGAATREDAERLAEGYRTATLTAHHLAPSAAKPLVPLAGVGLAAALPWQTGPVIRYGREWRGLLTGSDT